MNAALLVYTRSFVTLFSEQHVAIVPKIFTGTKLNGCFGYPMLYSIKTYNLNTFFKMCGLCFQQNVQYYNSVARQLSVIAWVADQGGRTWEYPTENPKSPYEGIHTTYHW